VSAQSRRIRFWALLLLVLLAVGGASAGVYRLRQIQSAVILPVAPARQGDFMVIIRCRGELKSGRSVQIYTPMVPNLRIAWMTPPGEKVEKGETIVKFDSSSAEQQLQQKDAQLKQAQATLDQAVAQAKITAEQDQSDLADAKYTVEKAQLEVSKQEIVSRIAGEESKVDLGVAEQKLKVQEATVALHALLTGPRSPPSRACATRPPETSTLRNRGSHRWNSRRRSRDTWFSLPTTRRAG
jgi:multidrug efflux pump subunit AcrA (membrane-fusion protein)